MSRATHAAAFIAGVTVASAIAAWAVPPRDVARFKTLDAFAQSLATVQTSYVDPVDEKVLIYNAARGMLHNLDQYSTFLPPNRYKNLRQDTEGEFGGVGITLSPGTLDENKPGMPPFPTIASSTSAASRRRRRARSSRTRPRGKASCAAPRAPASRSRCCAPAGRMHARSRWFASRSSSRPSVTR